MMSKKCPKCNVLLPFWCNECIWCGAKTETALPGLKADKNWNQKRSIPKTENNLKQQRA